MRTHYEFRYETVYVYDFIFIKKKKKKQVLHFIYILFVLSGKRISAAKYL